MPPRKKSTVARPASPSKRSVTNGPGSVKPVRSSRKKTLSPKAAAGVEDGVKPAHLTSLPKSRPLPSISKIANKDSSESGDSEAEDGDGEVDSEVEFFSSPKKSQVNRTGVSSSGGKRKAAPNSDVSDGNETSRPAPSPKKKKKASARSPSKADSNLDGQDDDVPSPPVTPSKKKRTAGSRTFPKKRPIMKIESDSEADASDAVMLENSGTFSGTDDGDHVTYVNLVEPTESDLEFIAPEDDEEDSSDRGMHEEDVVMNSDADPNADGADSEDEEDEEEDEDAGPPGATSGVDADDFSGDSDVASVPPSSVASSPRKRVRMQTSVDTEDEEDDDDDLVVVATPPRSGGRGSAVRRSATTTPKTPTKGKVTASAHSPRQLSGRKPTSTGRTSGTRVSSSSSPRKDIASVASPKKAASPTKSSKATTPSRSGKGKRKEIRSIKEQGAVSPHKDNTSTRSCHITSSKIMDEFLMDTYRDLYPLKPVHIASAAGVEVMLTPFSWLRDGTYGNKPINTDLLKDVIIFAECGDLPFVNPARFPPSRLQGVQTNSTKTVTFNLATKALSMGPVCCITFGTVVDSHLFHPRIPKTSATHGITIFPFKGEWERTLGCLGNALGEDSFSHYIHVGGVTFQGTWSSAPTSDQKARWEEEQAGSSLPIYVPPKNPLVVASSASSDKPGPGQAQSSGRGLVGRGPPSVNYGTKIPVFDCTRFFQPRRAGDFATMTSLSDFFAQAGDDLCPQIVGEELRNKSMVAVCYTASKWRSDESPNRFNLGLNVRAVYLLVNGKKD